MGIKMEMLVKVKASTTVLCIGSIGMGYSKRVNFK
jgi:hypothetical protein